MVRRRENHSSCNRVCVCKLIRKVVFRAVDKLVALGIDEDAIYLGLYASVLFTLIALIAFTIIFSSIWLSLIHI